MKFSTKVSDTSLLSQALNTKAKLQAKIDIPTIPPVPDPVTLAMQAAKKQVASVDVMRAKETVNLLTEIFINIKAENQVVASMISGFDMKTTLQDSISKVAAIGLPKVETLLDMGFLSERIGNLSDIAMRAQSPLGFASGLLAASVATVGSQLSSTISMASNLVQNISIEQFIPPIEIKRPNIDFVMSAADDIVGKIEGSLGTFSDAKATLTSEAKTILGNVLPTFQALPKTGIGILGGMLKDIDVTLPQVNIGNLADIADSVTGITSQLRDQYDMGLSALGDIHDALDGRLADMAVSLASGVVGGIGTTLSSEFDAMFGSFMGQTTCLNIEGSQQVVVTKAFDAAMKLTNSIHGDLGLGQELSLPKLPLRSPAFAKPKLESRFEDLFGIVNNIDVSLPEVDLKLPEVDVRGIINIEPVKATLQTAQEGLLQLKKDLKDIDIGSLKAQATAAFNSAIPDIDLKMPRFEMPDLNLELPSLNIDLPKFELPDPTAILKAKLQDMTLKMGQLEFEMSAELAELSAKIDAQILSLSAMCINYEKYPNCPICRGRGITKGLQAMRTAKFANALPKLSVQSIVPTPQWSAVNDLF
jgi:hypothetical protein